MTVSPSPLMYASGWRRCGAYVIDAVIFLVISFVSGAVLGFTFALASPATDERTVELVAQLAGIAVGWLYFAALESSSRQATAGKQALGIVVTDEHGRRITFARATGRYFAKILSAITFGIGYLMIVFTGKKQGLHDKVARTLVVDR
jgi:uncharacterized RDD family membrane protein YckC